MMGLTSAISDNDIESHKVTLGHAPDSDHRLMAAHWSEANLPQMCSERQSPGAELGRIEIPQHSNAVLPLCPAMGSTGQWSGASSVRFLGAQQPRGRSPRARSSRRCPSSASSIAQRPMLLRRLRLHSTRA
jgi:hypothetical protein